MNNNNSKARGCLNYLVGGVVSFVVFLALIPEFIGEGFWPMSANSSRAKNVLALAMRDCNLKFLEGIEKPTFEDIGLPEIPLHPEWPKDIFSFYTDSSFSNPIEKSDSCFSLAAKPSTKYSQANKLTWFSIKFDPKDDVVIKNCGDSEKKYCEEGNTW